MTTKQKSAMRFKLTLAALAACALFTTAAAQEAQPQDDQRVIDDFVQTRGFEFVDPSEKPSAKGAAAKRRPRRQPAKPGGAQGTQSSAAAKKTAPAAAQGGVPLASASAPKAGAQPIGLGYTLYKVEGGQLVATSESSEFREGERIRLALETNTDGYLYVFNTTNGAEPVMLYPHATLDAGRNRIAAHRSEYVPARDAGFRFDDKAGVERLYVFVSRRPLDGVPTGDELLAKFPRPGESSYWFPTAEQWSRLEALSRQGGRVRQGRLGQFAQLSPVASETATRGFTVTKDAPPPAVVRINDSPDADVLVTVISLVHK